MHQVPTYILITLPQLEQDTTTIITKIQYVVQYSKELNILRCIHMYTTEECSTENHTIIYTDVISTEVRT